MTKKEIERRVPEAKDLNQDQVKAAVNRAKDKIEKFISMSYAELAIEVSALCVELEYLREVKDFQKEIIQKRAKNA